MHVGRSTLRSVILYWLTLLSLPFGIGFIQLIGREGFGSGHLGGGVPAFW
jgi:hypothetical protein